MAKLGIMLPTGERVEAEIVRYFDAYGKKYLVYTLNEKDEQGFVKLYVAKVDGAPKALVGEFIGDDNEWSVLKGEFKKIIGENSDSGRTSANDMNPGDLENINVRGHRIIKLMESYVNLLGANKKNFEVQPAAPAYQAPAPDLGFQVPPTPAYQAPTQAFEYQAPSAPAYPETPAYQAPTPDLGYQAPSAPTFPETPAYQNPGYGFQAPEAAVYPQPAMPAFEPQAPAAPIYPDVATPTQNYAQPATNNFEEMYNDVKAKLERCTTELEKVTNENIELRIKIDDIREILNEN